MSRRLQARPPRGHHPVSRSWIFLPAVLPLAHCSRRPERSVILEGLPTHRGVRRPLCSLFLFSCRRVKGPFQVTEEALWPSHSFPRAAKVGHFHVPLSGTSRRKSQWAALCASFPEFAALT